MKLEDLQGTTMGLSKTDGERTWTFFFEDGQYRAYTVPNDHYSGKNSLKICGENHLDNIDDARKRMEGIDSTIEGEWKMVENYESMRCPFVWRKK